MDMIGSSISIDRTKVKANASSRQRRARMLSKKKLIRYSKRALRPINMKMKFMVIQHHIRFQKNWLTRKKDWRKLKLLRRSLMKKS